MNKSIVSLFFVIALLFVACGDDDNSFIARDSEGTLLSSGEEAADNSSSSVDDAYSSSVSLRSSSSETSVSSSSNEGDAGSEQVRDDKQPGMTSSSAKSSSSAMSSSSVTPPSSSSISSSSEESSSSVIPAEPCKTETTDTCEYGTMTDDRDGKTYKTVKIGEQWWMAENLNFRYLHPTKSMDSTSFCVNDSLENCEKYGRQYMWNAAMDSAGRYSTAGKGCGNRTNYINCVSASRVRGVCPENWHLPSKSEFETLLAAVGGKNIAAKVLKTTSGWDDDSNGTDAFGFSALPAGDRYAEFRYEGEVAFFWSATGVDEYRAWHMNFMYGDANANIFDFQKGHAFSVRCLKDSD